MGAAQNVGLGLRQAEMAHLALLDQPRHRAHRVLHRHLGIDPVQVIEVDDVGAEPFQAALAGHRHVVRPGVGAAALALRPADVAELAADEGVVPPPLQCLRQQFLVMAVAIGVRAVEKIDAEIEGAADRGNRFRVVPRQLLRRHAGTAEADGGNRRAGAPQGSLLHGPSSLTVEYQNIAPVHPVEEMDQPAPVQIHVIAVRARRVIPRFRPLPPPRPGAARRASPSACGADP